MVFILRPVPFQQAWQLDLLLKTGKEYYVFITVSVMIGEVAIDGMFIP
jgi:hypothetical protein